MVVVEVEAAPAGVPEVRLPDEDPVAPPPDPPALDPDATGTRSSGATAQVALKARNVTPLAVRVNSRLSTAVSNLPESPYDGQPKMLQNDVPRAGPDSVELVPELVEDGTAASEEPAVELAPTQVSPSGAVPSFAGTVVLDTAGTSTPMEGRMLVDVPALAFPG